MSRGFQHNAIVEHAACVELAAIQHRIAEAIRERNAVARYYLDRNARAHVLADQLGVSRATFYRMLVDDPTPKPGPGSPFTNPTTNAQIAEVIERRRTRNHPTSETVSTTPASKKLRKVLDKINEAPLPATAKARRQPVDSQPGGQGQPSDSPRPKRATSAKSVAAKPAAKSRRQSPAGTKTKAAGASSN